MSKRFSRKEFVAGLSFNLYPWRVTLGVAGKLVLLAALLWIFPVEQYGLGRENRKWYLLGFSVFAFWLGWDLLKKRTSTPFGICPNCGKRIFIFLGPVKAGKPGGSAWNFSLLPSGAVGYFDGTCPHCEECVWEDGPEDEPAAARALMEKQDLLHKKLSAREILLFIMLLMSPVLVFVPFPLARELFIYFKVPNYSAVVFLMVLLVAGGRLITGIFVRCFDFPRCPACGEKLLETDIETRTGRCHCCGESILDMETQK